MLDEVTIVGINFDAEPFTIHSGDIEQALGAVTAQMDNIDIVAMVFWESGRVLFMRGDGKRLYANRDGVDVDGGDDVTQI